MSTPELPSQTHITINHYFKTQTEKASICGKKGQLSLTLWNLNELRYDAIILAILMIQTNYINIQDHLLDNLRL